MTRFLIAFLGVIALAAGGAYVLAEAGDSRKNEALERDTTASSRRARSRGRSPRAACGRASRGTSARWSIRARRRAGSGRARR